MRLIDADALKQDLTRFYDNEVTAKQLIDEQPTVGEGIAEALECYRRQCHGNGIVCEQTKCKWRCEGRNVGLDYGYCAFNNLLGDVVRLLGRIPGEGAILRGKID